MRLSKGPSKTHELLSTVAGEASQSMGSSKRERQTDAADPGFLLSFLAGDAENINKQARKMRTNWVTNKQTADGFLRAAAVEGARTAFLRGQAPPTEFLFLCTEIPQRVACTTPTTRACDGAIPRGRSVDTSS